MLTAPTARKASVPMRSTPFPAQPQGMCMPAWGNRFKDLAIPLRLRPGRAVRAPVEAAVSRAQTIRVPSLAGCRMTGLRPVVRSRDIIKPWLVLRRFRVRVQNSWPRIVRRQACTQRAPVRRRRRRASRTEVLVHRGSRRPDRRVYRPFWILAVEGAGSVPD